MDIDRTPILGDTPELIRGLAYTIANHATSIADGTSTNELGAAALIRSNAETLHAWIAAKVQPS